jgi:hypothetical protein
MTAPLALIVRSRVFIQIGTDSTTSVLTRGEHRSPLFYLHTHRKYEPFEANRLFYQHKYPTF